MSGIAKSDMPDVRMDMTIALYSCVRNVSGMFLLDHSAACAYHVIFAWWMRAVISVSMLLFHLICAPRYFACVRMRRCVLRELFVHVLSHGANEVDYGFKFVFAASNVVVAKGVCKLVAHVVV